MGPGALPGWTWAAAKGMTGEAPLGLMKAGRPLARASCTCPCALPVPVISCTCGARHFRSGNELEGVRMTMIILSESSVLSLTH